MTLDQLFQKRARRYLKNLLHYARRIVNDHFILVFFLLSGVGGYVYAQFLEDIAQGAIMPRIFVLILFLIWTATGNITLLVEPADRVFLLPKERAFQKVFKRLTVGSFLTQTLLAVLLTFIVFPIFVATLQAKPIDSVLIFVALVSVKWLNWLVKIEPFFHGPRINKQWLLALRVLGSFLGLSSLLFINLPITTFLLVALALFGAFQFLTGRIYFEHLMNWEILIEKEERRLDKLYRFIQLFMDVPHKKTRIRRLAWLDRPLQWFSKRTPSAPYYYLLRVAVRNTEYSLLVLRVTLLGMFLLAITDSLLTGLALLFLFLYIIGFQLLPLANHLERTPQFQLYPVTEHLKAEAVSWLIFQLLSVVSFFLALASMPQQSLRGGLLLFSGLFFAYFFSYMYAPRRLEQAQK